MLNISIIVPALSNLGVFKNDLLTKLSGKALIDHAIDKCLLMTNHSNIYVVTDNEEVDLLCSRKGVMTQLYFGDELSFELDSLITLKKTIEVNTPHVVLLSPYALFLEIDTVRRALELSKNGIFVKPAVKLDGEVYFRHKNGAVITSGLNDTAECYKTLKTFILCESKVDESFKVTQRNILIKNEIDLEFKSRHDIWVYEKLLNRKKIVFNVAASKEIGMGHVYRALSLAHEIIEHEVVFVCNDESSLAVIKLSEHEYPVYICPKNELSECIKNLTPSLVINDFLNTDTSYMDSLRLAGIKTINFEDLGPGARKADCTINDLYDEPLYKSDNTLWGHEYFFVRDEFYSAIPHSIDSKVESVLLTFGGTDQNDFTRKFYRTIKEFCSHRQIKLYIVTGEGYSYLKELEEELSGIPSEQIEFVHKTGVMSSLMEKSQIAISSNGRTVYELAHMNIPTIVISHHSRESNHKFSCFDHGFVNLGTYLAETTESQLMLAFEKLVNDHEYRKGLISSMEKFSFVKNKNKINNLISSLIN
ncbi:MAG: spore coat polysaccharide biosynthesis predicted glycosyltransferase SpsG [Oleiphilaceae bacterium]|jgi:spore coat polysaccharide biosynthesis predicted glycosyltransferase SpsG